MVPDNTELGNGTIILSVASDPVDADLESTIHSLSLIKLTSPIPCAYPVSYQVSIYNTSYTLALSLTSSSGSLTE